jgi:rsbT co-antagonist protein RsbR
MQNEEIDKLKARVTELEREAEALRRSEAEARRERALLRQVIHALPVSIFWKDRSSVYLGVNPVFLEHTGFSSVEDIIGKTDRDCVWTHEQQDKYIADDRTVMESPSGVLRIREEVRRADGDTIWIETVKIALRDEQGRVFGLAGMAHDITARKLDEDALTIERESLITAQAALLSELSTPLLPIHENVLVMPLIGRIEEARSRVVMERLLEGVVQHQAETVILDLTGVPVVDVAVANGVLAMARAAELLGARVVLTGIRPELARTIVDVAIDLGDVQTFGTLRDGVAYATQGTRRGKPTRRRASIGAI